MRTINLSQIQHLPDLALAKSKQIVCAANAPILTGLAAAHFLNAMRHGID